MTFLGFKETPKNMLFMRAPNNVLFTAATALFDEKLFPRNTKTRPPAITELRKRIPNEPFLEIKFEEEMEDLVDETINPPTLCWSSE